MQAVEYLQQIEKIDTLIENKTFDVEREKAAAQRITSQLGGERVQSSGSKQKMSEAIDKYIDGEEEIKELKRQRAEIIQTIEQLKTLEYDALHKVYIQGYDLENFAAKYKRSKSWAKKIHGRALKNLQKLLDSRECVQK